jgi:hypothetical protein
MDIIEKLDQRLPLLLHIEVHNQIDEDEEVFVEESKLILVKIHRNNKFHSILFLNLSKFGVC